MYLRAQWAAIFPIEKVIKLLRTFEWLWLVLKLRHPVRTARVPFGREMTVRRCGEKPFSCFWGHAYIFVMFKKLHAHVRVHPCHSQLKEDMVCHRTHPIILRHWVIRTPKELRRKKPASYALRLHSTHDLHVKSCKPCIRVFMLITHFCSFIIL